MNGNGKVIDQKPYAKTVLSLCSLGDARHVDHSHTSLNAKSRITGMTV